MVRMKSDISMTSRRGNTNVYRPWSAAREADVAAADRRVASGNDFGEPLNRRTVAAEVEEECLCSVCRGSEALSLTDRCLKDDGIARIDELIVYLENKYQLKEM